MQRQLRLARRRLLFDGACLLGGGALLSRIGSFSVAHRNNASLWNAGAPSAPLAFLVLCFSDEIS
jgi:hypothetical protein